MPTVPDEPRALLRLTLTTGLGPVLIGRAIREFGSAEAVLGASEQGLRRVEGIGADRARKIVAGFGPSAESADRELELAGTLGVSILGVNESEYPALLREIPDAPPIIYIRGTLAREHDKYPVGIVGSRTCTHYAIEQTTRFSFALAQAGLTVVSGGARGVDTAAHAAALKAGGRTIAVLGCGLANCYPPDNLGLFDQIAGGGGAVISELPLNTPPNAENFPARNRIISGLSLGVLVIEAGRKSGALITARVAAEDHGREVFALPARVDSSAAEGSLALLKSGGALLVTHPDDILQALESPARHAHQGSHEARFPARESQMMLAETSRRESTLDARASAVGDVASAGAGARDAGLTERQLSIMAALEEPRSMDQLSEMTGVPPAQLRAEITLLEIKRRVQRRGSLVARIS